MLAKKEGNLVKCTLIIDKERDEEIIIYAKERNKLTERIEALAQENEDPCEIIAYSKDSTIRLSPDDALCFISEDGRVLAVTAEGRLVVRERLWSLEERLGDAYVRLSQSCLANSRKIKSFDASLAGSLIAVFEGGYREYVSRRQMAAVKRRFIKGGKKK